MPMTRRLFALALVLLFALLPVRAEGTAAGYLNGREVFRVSYDEKLLTLDSEYYRHESTEDYFWQFILYNDFISVDCGIDVTSGDKSLFGMQPDEVDEYGLSLRNMYDGIGYTGEYLGAKYVPVTNGGRRAYVPFVMIRLSKAGEPDGYYAETVAHGYAIWFDCAREDRTVSDADALKLLEALLDSFSPVL